MGKVIRPTYPVEISIGILLLIFTMSFFLSFQLFETPVGNSGIGGNLYIGGFLVSVTVIIMVLVLWEELFFPIKIKPTDHGVEFRNHRTKLKKQLLIYCLIPVIIVFIFFTYQLNMFRFVLWAVVCTGAPVVGKLISGINNYNDFLKLNKDSIEYKNNEKVGAFETQKIQSIVLIKDEGKILHKVELVLKDNNKILIDLDEMELDAYLDSIENYLKEYYKELVTN